MDRPPERTSEPFRLLLERSIDREQSAVDAQIDAIRDELARLSRRFVTLDRQLVTHLRRAGQLPDLAERVREADLEYRRVLATPNVDAVDVADTTLSIVTAPVFIDWRGATYELGRYRVSLDLRGDLLIESLDKCGPKPNWDHPHVQDGRPCLGNLREGILKLIAEYELALATQIVVDFLHTYHPDGAYCSIEGWPCRDAGQ